MFIQVEHQPSSEPRAKRGFGDGIGGGGRANRWPRVRTIARALGVVLALVFVVPDTTPHGSFGPDVLERAGFCVSTVLRRPAALSFCWEQFEGLSSESAIALKRELGYKSPAANDRFIDDAVLKEPPPEALFIHIDNVMMKPLNDKIFRDKGLSAATEALWTRIFFETIDADVRTGVAGAEAPWVLYSDFKSIRLGFKKGSPELERWLSDVYKRASRRFTRELGEFETVDGILRQHGGMTAEPYKWHVGGIGRTPGLAAAASRAGRYRKTEPGQTRPLEDARDPALQKSLVESLHSLEEMRKRIQDDALSVFEDKLPPFLKLIPESEMAVLSRDVIDIFKRLDDVEGESFLEEATKAFQRRFERRFPDPAENVAWARLLHDLRAYYRAVDPFMPPIYERNEVMDLGFDTAKHGVVSRDLVGANKDNITEFMAQMAKTMAEAKRNRLGGKTMTNAELLDLAIKRAKIGQARASHKFHNRHKPFLKAVEQLGVKGKVVISGDEELFYPERPLTPQERERFAALLEAEGPADDGRTSFVPPTYHGRSEVIPPARLAAYANFNEAVEKNLRIDLEMSGAIPRTRLQKIGITLDLEANDVRAGTISLVLSGEVSTKDREAIERSVKAMLPKGFEMGATRVVPQLAKPK